MISRALVEVGLGRGHDIRVSSVRPRKTDVHAQPDLILFIDIHNHAHSWRSLGAWRGFDQAELRHASRRAPFVHMTNAYVDLCGLPYLPCTGNRTGTCCPAKPEVSWVRRNLLFRDQSMACTAKMESRLWLYRDAALNVYLSPLHAQVSETLIGLPKPPPFFIMPPTIDTTRFFNQQIERDIDFLFVGVISEAKGFKAMREKFAGENIVLIGKCAPGIEVDFGTHIDHLPYDQIPLYMNRARNFVFLPRWPEPQGRVVAEAALCGCNIIGNDNVGALSFGYDLSDSKIYHDNEGLFWNRVEEILQ
jgi:glycosyltransferase involved in cell wall biosynthesis